MSLRLKPPFALVLGLTLITKILIELGINALALSDRHPTYHETPSDRPLEKVQNNNDNYNVFVNKRQHHEKPESINGTYVMEKDDRNIKPDPSDMSDNGREVDQNDEQAEERALLASLSCYNDNLALMLAPETDKTIRLAQES
ncbi:hypothetical protein Tco_1071109 [Tanacetum coccineum]|uniref:Uncharacterized protein n=1 Tax=Tanacetum coccineum TaxID=301880 RepID=A0ABQ5HPX5_9ASTR